jgi:hypothetical protein
MRLLDCIDGKKSDGIDTKLVQFTRRNFFARAPGVYDLQRPAGLGFREGKGSRLRLGTHTLSPK